MRTVHVVRIGLCLAALAPSVARADDEVPGHELCDVTDGTVPLCDDDGNLLILPEMGFPPRRLTTVRAALSGMLSWPAPVEGRGAGGLRVMVSPYLPFSAPWFQWDLLAGLYVGSWGDRQHSGATVETGAGARLRFPALGFFSIGPMLNASALYSSSEQLGGFRGDVGIAGELGRVVGLELCFTSLVSRFEVDDKQYLYAPGLSAAVSFDFCSLSTTGCAHDEPSTELDDHTCAIYREAQQLCLSSPASLRAALCQAVEQALDTYANPALDYDPVTTLLAYARDRSTGQARQELSRLLAAHEHWRRWLDDGGRARRLVAQANQDLAVDRRYAPYPVELAHALGCDAATSCEDVCEP